LEASVGHDRTSASGQLEVLVETKIGIAVLLAGVGVLWVCFALGMYLFTRTGREGVRIQREMRQRPSELDGSGGG
jgi:hypothetical protein